MKKLVCLLLICLLFLSMTACERNNTNVRVYEEYAENDRYLPNLDELGEYRSVQTLHHHDSALFFLWDAYHLIAEYDESQYEQAKAALDERYTFREEMIDSAEESGGTWVGVSFSPYCDMDGYHLRVLDTGRDGYGFPKDVYFIGTNDKSHKIIYIRFYDSDLDSIESLESFLLNECGWSVLIKKDML